MLFDALRGTGTNRYRVNSNTTATEITDDPDVTLVSDGFTVSTSDGGMNANTDTYVGWNWKGDGVAGGTTNNDGETTSQVNVNTTSGFSTFKYTGKAGSNAQTMGHGLTQAPELVIVKDLNAGGSWFVGSTPTSWDYKLRLNSTDARVDETTWNDTAPTATIVTVGAVNVATDGVNYIAYCFHSVEGYSKVGSYTGNGNADGTFVYTGFRPAYVTLKITSSTNDWITQDNKRDTYNAVGHYLRPNLNAAELDEDTIDFLSNGFKLRTTSGARNTSSGSYIYLAFAESPFKTSNAR